MANTVHELVKFIDEIQVGVSKIKITKIIQLPGHFWEVRTFVNMHFV
jgi:hypothetical protein